MNPKREESIRKLLTELRHDMPDVGLVQWSVNVSPVGNVFFTVTYGKTTGIDETIEGAKNDLRKRMPVVKERLEAQAKALDEQATSLREQAKNL